MFLSVDRWQPMLFLCVASKLCQATKNDNIGKKQAVDDKMSLVLARLY